MTDRQSPDAQRRTHVGTGAGSAALRRAVETTKYGMPRYTRELLASLKEAGGQSIASAMQPVSGTPANLRGFGSAPDAIDAIWIGHATVLLHIGGINILTDPVFSDRIGMRLFGRTFGIRRVRPPALDVDHLPGIDVVLLSHAHFDHLDRPSLERLAAGPGRGAVVVTATSTRRLIPGGFSQVIELGWDHRATTGSPGGDRVQLSAMRPTHWGARTVADRHRGFNAYLIETEARRMFFAGDTALTDRFARIGPTDLSIFGIGAYDPWEHAHATPEQVWAMHTGMSGSAAPGHLLAMHHSTFVLGREPMDEPLRRLLAAADDMEHRIIGRGFGDHVCVGVSGSPENRGE
ncbi:MAG: MBL fold metallo-hydrolase [Phycisphaerales bacterium]|nr:MBL fold metallo-hydrolase [Phycisphaerales bacterium]